MTPLEEYNSLIHLRRKNPLPKGEYGEVHHIIPKSCSGTNEAWNKVKLTPEEHYRAHCLLTFIYPQGREHHCMVKAWGRLHFDGKRKVAITEEEYGRLRRELHEAHQGKVATFFWKAPYRGNQEADQQFPQRRPFTQPRKEVASNDRRAQDENINGAQGKEIHGGASSSHWRSKPPASGVRGDTKEDERVPQEKEISMNKGGFSWKRFLGLTRIKRSISKTTGIPLSRTGMEAKIGRVILKTLFK